jgi:hypothetical protein
MISFILFSTKLHDVNERKLQFFKKSSVIKILFIEQTFLFIEMINKAGNLRRGMAGIEPTPSKS